MLVDQFLLYKISVSKNLLGERFFFKTHCSSLNEMKRLKKIGLYVLHRLLCNVFNLLLRMSKIVCETRVIYTNNVETQDPSLLTLKTE